ncbi:MAG: InlB B-repeat-containing protein [Clostridia bacterium]|nr:InlB B-repeat-containing protein [Clostridia bacterium]
MKKFYILLCIAALCLFIFGCREIDDANINTEPTVHSVTFISEGKTYESNIIETGNVVAPPIKDPTKTNHKFLGWYTDGDYSQLYDFSTPVTKSIRLYAKFQLDTEALALGAEKAKNHIVKIQNKCYNSEDDATVIDTLGVIFVRSGKYCYTLAPCHAVKKMDNYKAQEVTVFDVDGNSYKGYSYRRSEQDPVAIIEEYDLALVCFEYSGSKLGAVERQTSNPDIGDIAIALDAKDKIAYGEITDYKAYEWDVDENLSNVDFDVLHHSAVLEGSKESILFDISFSLVGITYTTEDGTAYAIPASRIHEFLYKYVY